jgi:hypothetical protein
MLPTTRPKPWFLCALVVVAVLYVLWKVAPVQLSHQLLLISPFHARTPHISGTVVDAMTGRPLPGMDICLLITVNDDFVGHTTKVMKSATTRTDASGMFSLARWDGTLDLFERGYGYGIAVTDPAARWDQKCAGDVYLLGRDPDVLQRELDLERGQPGSAENRRLPYFPAAVVGDPSNPYPFAYGHGLLDWLPSAALVQKIDDPKNVKVSLFPLLTDEKQCQSADSKLVEWCRWMNVSSAADALRKIAVNSSAGQ